MVELLVGMTNICYQHDVTAGHFFKEDLAHFDAPFFNLTRAEAEVGFLFLGHQTELHTYDCRHLIPHSGFY